MTIDNDMRRYILDRVAFARERMFRRADAMPGRSERAVLKALREIEEAVK